MTVAPATAPLPAALAAPPARPAGRWRRLRAPLALAAAVLLAAVAGLALLGPAGGGYLDPGSVAPDGARAVVQVLRTQGVDVRVRTRFDDVARDLAGADATVVVARTDLLLGRRAADLRSAVQDAGADLALIGPQQALLTDLGLPLVVTGTEPDDSAVRDPSCSDVVAARAGSALLGGLAYRAAGDGAVVTACYPVAAGAGLVSLTGPGGGRTTVLGSGDALTNERLADAGDAALAVGTLGARARLVWWTPNPADTGVGPPPSLRDLLPPGVLWAAGQLVVALLVAMVWRGRRLGRLVPEPLPVVVRSVETTLGRGRLYRRARARGRAASVLRAAAVERVAVACHLSRSADPREVAVAAAVRTRRPVADVTALLLGPEPADDATLVTLARALDSLDTEVRRA